MKTLSRSSVVALRIWCAGMVTASGWSRGVRGRVGRSRSPKRLISMLLCMAFVKELNGDLSDNISPEKSVFFYLCNSRDIGSLLRIV